MPAKESEVEQRLVERLSEAGFTEYEAKAYLALLRSGPLKVQALSDESKVPRNKLYGVLESLAAKGIVEIRTLRPLECAAKPIRGHLEHRITRLQELQKALHGLGSAAVLA